MKKMIPMIGLLAIVQLALAQPYITWHPAGIGGGGALFGLSFNPANDDEFYVASDLSALYHTTDFGAHYSLVPFSELQGGNYSTVQFTNDAQRLYAIDHTEQAPSYEAFPVRSTDGGQSWEPLPGNPEPFEALYHLFADYDDPARLILGYYGAIYYSNDNGDHFNLVKMASDNGAGIITGGVCFAGDTILVGTNEGLIVTTNGGINWSTPSIAGIPNDQAIWRIAAARDGNTIRILAITADKGDVYEGLFIGGDYWGFAKGVYRLDFEAGATWQPASAGLNFDTDFPMLIAMANNDIATAYVAGSNTSGVPTVFKTMDGGVSWIPVFLTDDNLNIATGYCGDNGDERWWFAEVTFSLAVAPNNSQRVAFTDYGFVHTSLNGGTIWEQAYIDKSDQNAVGTTATAGRAYGAIGLENTACWSLAWSDPQHLFAGYTDIRGARSEDAGEKWSFDFMGNDANTMYKVLRHQNGQLYASTSNIHDIYQWRRYLQDNYLDSSDQEGKIKASSDHGVTWTTIHSFGHPVYWIAVDPSHPDRMYASVVSSTDGRVYVTNNLSAGANSIWQALPPPPNTQGRPACIEVLNDGKVLCSYSGRYSSNTYQPVAGIFLYDPVSDQWQDRSTPQMRYWMQDIAVWPGDPTQNTWFACVYNTGGGGASATFGGLYRTTDRGQNWTRVFDQASVSSVTFHPDNPNIAYISTDGDGLWYTENADSSQMAFNMIDNYYFARPKRVFFNPYDHNELWVSSYGYGLTRGTIQATNIFEPEKDTFIEAKISPNPAKDQVVIQLPENENTGTCRVVDSAGKQWEQFAIHQNNFAINTAHWPAGMYWATIKTKGKRYRARWVNR